MVALVLGQFLVLLDSTVMSVALPQIQGQFSIGLAPLQWAVVAYLVAFAAIAVPIGALGDQLGRRTVYLFGCCCFVVGSAVCAIAPGISVLILGRVFQGVGGGTMGTLAIAILVSSFSADQTPRVIGIWTAASAGAMALGPLVGGILVTTLGWRSVFGINVVLMLLVIPMVLRLVPKSPPLNHTAEKIDWLSTALLTVALVLIAGGISLLGTAPVTDLTVLGPITTGVLVVVVFVFQQRRAVQPLTHWPTIIKAPIPAGLAVLVLLNMVLAGVFMQQMLLLQNVLGWSPLLAGLVTMGASGAVVIFSPISARILERLGLGMTVGLGQVITALGVWGLSLTGVGTSAAQVAVAFALMGIGLGISIPSMTSGVMMVPRQEQLGAVSGFVALVQAMAAVLGLTLLNALAAFLTASTWNSTAQEVSGAEALIPLVIAGDAPAVSVAAGQRAGELAGLAYTHGVSGCLTLCAALLLMMALASPWLFGSTGRITDVEPAKDTVTS